MKKALSLIVLLCMLASMALVGGCGNLETNASGTEGPEETAEITAIWWTNGGIVKPEALEKVNVALNAITIPKINVKVNLKIMDVATYIGTAATSVANNEDVDLMVTFPAAAAHFTPMMAQNMLLPLDDLLATYCQETLDLIPEAWWQAVQKDGKTYGVPMYYDKVNSLAWVYDQATFDALGFKAEDIKTLDDIHEVLLAVKTAYPDKTPISGDYHTLDITYPGMNILNGTTFDAAGDSNCLAGVVEIAADGTTDYKVTSHFEGKQYTDVIDRLAVWYSENLIDKDVMNYEGNGTLVNDTVFSKFQAGTPTSLKTWVENQTIKSGSVTMTSGVVTTGALIQFATALPVSCDEPEAAAKFLNMMYTDAEMVNLVNNGIEGEHYIINANGELEYPAGVDKKTTTYRPNAANFVGNYFLNKPWSFIGQAALDEELQALKDSKTSPILGFTFDPTPVADIYAQLSTLSRDQYRPALECGSAQAGYYDEFITKMKDAGLQTYLDEMQKQLDAWVAANK